MNSFDKGYIFRSVSLLREAHDSSSDNYTQHTPNPRLDLVRLETALEWKDAVIRMRKQNDTMLEFLEQFEDVTLLYQESNEYDEPNAVMELGNHIHKFLNSISKTEKDKHVHNIN